MSRSRDRRVNENLSVQTSEPREIARLSVVLLGVGQSLGGSRQVARGRQAKSSNLILPFWALPDTVIPGKIPKP